MRRIDERAKNEGNEYSITSFGYGSSHDEKVLSSMSDIKNGDFYYIANNNLVD